MGKIVQIEWIFSDEGKPKDGKRIMYSTTNGYVSIGRYNAEEDEVDCDEYFVDFKYVTAWSEVPKGYTRENR